MKTYGICALACCLVLLVLLGFQNISYAADNSTIIDAGTGITSFDTPLKTIANSVVGSAKVIAVIMTAVAGFMYVLGIETHGTKTMWSIVLGIGLALNFGGFFYSVFSSYLSGDATTAQVTQYQFSLKGESDGGIDILSGFMNNYTKNVIVPGAMAIQPTALKLLAILTIITSSLQLALDLVSGDKVKFLINICLKAGFYIFLITNWLSGIDLMNHLEAGFQEIGFLAGGAGADTTLKPDSIVNNAIVIFHAIWDNAKFSITSPGLLIINIVSLITIIACLFLTGIEMFMVRIEFYTMALITIPLLPFGMIKQFNFLSEKAIGVMFNLAIKVSVIAFISTVSIPFLKSFSAKIAATSDLYTQVSVILQAVLAAVVIYYITKRIPNIVQSYLSGSPTFGGGMVKMAASALAAAGGAAGAVRAASNMAGGGNDQRSNGTGNMMSQLGGTAMNLGKMAYLQNPVTKGFQATAKNFHDQDKARTGNRSTTPAEQRMQNPMGVAAKAPGAVVSNTARVVKAATKKLDEYYKKQK